MSEVTSVVKQEQQQQEYVGGSSNSELRCEDCNVSFNSGKSLEVHLNYHNENLLNKWSSQAQQQESNNNNNNNNNNKSGNHNRQSTIKHENLMVNLNEPSSTSSSQDPTSSQHQHQQQQSQQQQPVNQAFPFLQQIFLSDNYPPHNMSHNIPMGIHSFSPSHEDIQNNGGGNGGGTIGSSPLLRFHPYSGRDQSQRGTASSTSPRNTPIQCDKCGAVYEDANQLGEHVKANHSGSPTAYPSHYHQLSSPQQQDQSQQVQQQLHTSPTHSNQPQPQSNYDYNGAQTSKLEMKQEPEEQTEILDLDSHKVQTHRYEEEMRYQQQQHHHQELQMQMQQQQQLLQHQQQPRIGGGPHPMSTIMSSWGQGAQSHNYIPGPLPPMDGLSGIDQNQFMRSQHISVVDPSIHSTTPMMSNTPPIPAHSMTPGMLPQSSKPITNQSWKSNEARRPKTYNCTACNKWFTSSGHLKRHYNTTLHKNAVKQSNQPDPANQPISTHHHPGRDNNNVGPSTSARGSCAPTRSPDIISSGSPPNLMAGPSGEATRGLLHTPTTLYNNHSSNSNSSNSNDSSSMMALTQQQQGPPSAVHLGPGISLSSQQQASMAGHHQQQMGTLSHQVGLQHQQPHLQHLQMTSASQLHQGHRSMNSLMHPPPPVSHMNSPSIMVSSSHPHHMNLSSIPSNTGHLAVSSTAMGATSMPQPYPNAMPPHVTNAIPNIPELLVSIPTTTTGNDQNQQQNQQQQQQNQELVLPAFNTIQSSVIQIFIPDYAPQDHQQSQATNVGGLSLEETSPQGKSLNSSDHTDYELYNSNFSTLNLQNAENNMTQYNMQTLPALNEFYEHNNNLQVTQPKQELNSNVVSSNTSQRRGRKKKSAILTEQQVTSSTNSSVTSQNGPECIECAKKFNKPCYLTQHNKSFHCGDKPFKCPQCGKRFPSEKEHQDHMSKHAGEKPYKCNSCPKQFNHKTDLRRHNCLHTGEKPFACTECFKGFIRKDHMVKHMETHKKKANGRQQKENVRATKPSCSST